MAKRPASRTTITTVLSVGFLTVTLLAGLLAFLWENPYADADAKTSSSKPSSSEQENDPREEDPLAEDPLPDDSDPDAGSDSDIEQLLSQNEPAEPVYYNVPSELRAVTLRGGEDFMTSTAAADRTSQKLASEIDKAINAAREYTMNSIIIDTKIGDGGNVLFESVSLPQEQADLDCVEYAFTRGRDAGMFLYATYDVSDWVAADGTLLAVRNADGDTLDDIRLNIGAFAAKYQPDGILLDGYENPSNGLAYAQYLEYGGGIGYENYLQEVPRAQLAAATQAVREQAPGTQVGLMVNGVWENAAADAQGSETSASYTSFGDGNADTRQMVLDGMFDFVMIKNYGATGDGAVPFAAVAAWWGEVVREANITAYTMHAADRVGSTHTGYSAYEQLSRQLIELDKVPGYFGSAFNSLKAMQANPNSTKTLVQYLNDQIDESYVLTQLAVTMPTEQTFTTREPNVTFQGASDPREPVTLNKEKIPTNESGYFTIREELAVGVNTFTIAHKNKEVMFNITYEPQVLKEVMPVGNITVDGGMDVEIAALAYENASVVATVNGQTITLTPSDADVDEANRQSGYTLFTGVFTAPSASPSSATKIGNIAFSGTSASGVTQNMQGAAVTVNKKPVMGDGAIVQVVAEQAETFPTNTLNDSSSPNYYPLPKGTVDKTYGDEIVYKDGKTTKTFRNLESGVRVYTEDITTGGVMPDQNVISAMSVKSTTQYTTLTLTTASKVPYTVSYDGSKIVFKFQYTSKVPETSEIEKNPLFSDAAWSGSNLTLTLRRTGGFMGYKATYDGMSLQLRFNNSPGSLSGARIVVDPGHGGKDPGALGFYPGKDEADINYEIAQKLVSELKDRGATVLMTTQGSTMATRLAAARAFNPQVLVSVHGNSSTNSSATGTEVYYFYPFQKQLASNISANIASALGTTNRGGKAARYYMTRESQFTAVLAEVGFVSNEGEYTKMIASKYQSRIATAIANGIESYLSATSSGVKASGGDEDDDDKKETGSSSGGGSGVSSGKKDEDKDTGEDPVEDVALSRETLSLTIGSTHTLTATVSPSSAKNKDVEWESDDESVATVNQSGKVTAKKAGVAYISAVTDDGGYVAECRVTVKKSSSTSGLVQEITILYDKDEMGVDTRMELEVEVSPLDAKDTGVSWSTSDKSVLIIRDATDYGCKVEGVSNGTVTVTALALDGSGVKDTLKIYVGTGKKTGGSGSSGNTPDPTPGVAPESITIQGATAIDRSSREEYVATVLPLTAEDPGVKWTVSDSSILELYPVAGDENRIKVAGLKKGTATLTATSYFDKKVKKSIKITVS